MADSTESTDSTESMDDLVACEDTLTFVNAAITSTGQREFHSDAAEQRLTLGFLHDYMRINYRDVYASALALEINDHNAVRIIVALLLDPPSTPQVRRHEGALIAARLRRLPPQRVYRAFRQLRSYGVNNRRTRAIMRDWLASRPDLALDAVKYRSGLKAVASHAHLRLDGELGGFLYAPLKQARYATPILEQWRRAHYDKKALYELPYTVAEGLAAEHGIDRGVFLERIAPRLTRLERLRLTETANRLDAKSVEVDLAAQGLTRLATYVLSLPMARRKERRAELTTALETAARKAAGRHAGTWGRVTAVLDDSFSSYGSGVKRRRPLAVSLACHFLLRTLASEYRGLWLSGAQDPLLVRPYGCTALGTRIVDALETQPERLVIVSDGWDNAPPGLAREVLRIWRTRLDPTREVSVVHLNPVFDASEYDVKRLAPTVPTAGIRNADDLPALVEIAQFAEGRTGLEELQAHLRAGVERFVEAP